MDNLIVLYLMFALFAKHFIVDFILQTDDMVRGKGIYGNTSGILHSFHHGFSTFLVTVSFVEFFGIISILLVSIIDFVTHYHIDYIKMRFGCRDVTKNEFWVQLGLDQFAHYVVYIIIIGILIWKI